MAEQFCLDARGCYRQCAAVRHGVARVETEIENDLMELVSIDDNRREVLLQMQLQFYISGESLAQHFAHLADQQVDVERLQHRFGFTGEGQQLLDERCSSLSRFEDRLCPLGEFLSVIMELFQQRRMPHDDAEDVVEVVRNAAGERADAFESLRLVELLLQQFSLSLRAFAFANIPKHRDDVFPRTKFRDGNGDFEINQGTVFADAREFLEVRRGFTAEPLARIATHPLIVFL
jgi:hypothetical protein